MINDNCYIGIDPGRTGAMAIITGSEVEFYDYEDDLTKMVNALKEAKPCMIMMEEVNAFPGNFKRRVVDKNTGKIIEINASQGVVSNFKFGMNYGIWQGMIRACGYEPKFVRPTTWQKAVIATTSRGDKKVVLNWCRDKYPQLRDNKLKLEKHTGRADALCVAIYGIKVIKGLV